nr:porin [Mycobacteroides abscessus subsp. massiliense]MDM2554253.1 porin [Mycobacteroides abscessus]
MRTVGIRRVVQSALTSLILVVGMVGLTVIGTG